MSRAFNLSSRRNDHTDLLKSWIGCFSSPLFLAAKSLRIWLERQKKAASRQELASSIGKLKAAFDTRHLKSPITRVTIVRDLFNLTSLTADTSAKAETQNALSRAPRTKGTFPPCLMIYFSSPRTTIKGLGTKASYRRSLLTSVTVLDESRARNS